jgi:hypothetical protein
MTARAAAQVPPARDRSASPGEGPCRHRFRPCQGAVPLPLAPKLPPSDKRAQLPRGIGDHSAMDEENMADRRAMSAPSPRRFLSREQTLSARLCHPCRVCHAAAHRPRQSVERCCHISPELRELNEAARVRISEQILARRMSNSFVSARTICSRGLNSAAASAMQKSMNGLIGSIRRECLDHMIVVGEAHLRRILRGYAAYYNVSRTHRSLNKDAPLHRAIERLGAVVSRPVLGDLHHQYGRI